MTSELNAQALPPHGHTTRLSSSSIIVVVAIIALAIILSILINRILKHFHLLEAANEASNELVSITIEDNNPNVGGTGECAVCLSEFEANEQLRFLPCSHVFHAECVDSWFLTSRTCPLCRSAIPRMRCLGDFSYLGSCIFYFYFLSYEY
ncbi:hypothetical protein ACJIZ3_007555 [Penstemon smallii]|uniref:RING-type domain-containing protein n=1 Tax=Penstemon smallii TaxID=265156 RepID=A0ABD3T7B2_9LAMI